MVFKEHKYKIWGDYCECGSECYVLQNKFHPWTDDADLMIKMNCPNCKQIIEIDKSKAEKFYDQKIHFYFNDLEGDVIDLGCGAGFLSEYLVEKDAVSKIYALDNDESCIEDLNDINDIENKIEFLNTDICNLREHFKLESIDYVVSRDVFMFIEDTDKYFDDITEIVKKGIKQMGWFVSGNERMKNNLLPDQIAEELKKRGWKVKIEYLDWYASGYFIEAIKMTKAF